MKEGNTEMQGMVWSFSKSERVLGFCPTGTYRVYTEDMPHIEVDCKGYSWTMLTKQGLLNMLEAFDPSLFDEGAL